MGNARKRLTDSKLLVSREEIQRVLARYDATVTERLNQGLADMAGDFDRELEKRDERLVALEAHASRPWWKRLLGVR